jgi:hypothetical protein
MRLKPFRPGENLIDPQRLRRWGFCFILSFVKNHTGKLSKAPFLWGIFVDKLHREIPIRTLATKSDLVQQPTGSYCPMSLGGFTGFCHSQCPRTVPMATSRKD